MKAKWYFGALIIILTLFGASQENLIVPNQEVVLKFSGDGISANQVQLTIANVKLQLETIGVSNVDIREEANGRLVISYFSDTTVAKVKNILLDKTAIDFASKENSPLEFPTEQTYNLDVFEITKTGETGFGSTGKLFFELKQDYDRFSNPNVPVFAAVINSNKKNSEVYVAYKQHKTIATAINNIPHKIPEGRAGPVS
ncbi:MAG: hypothetical protein QNK89_02230 [Lacinutrix sp.]|uniref:hypothetical protein n=1 Tax=Lacinutrix sp. TaxID=1937692 RepID=UPI0030B7F205